MKSMFKMVFFWVTFCGKNGRFMSVEGIWKRSAAFEPPKTAESHWKLKTAFDGKHFSLSPKLEIQRHIYRHKDMNNTLASLNEPFVTDWLPLFTDSLIHGLSKHVICPVSFGPAVTPFIFCWNLRSDPRNTIRPLHFPLKVRCVFVVQVFPSASRSWFQAY